MARLMQLGSNLLCCPVGCTRGYLSPAVLAVALVACDSRSQVQLTEGDVPTVVWQEEFAASKDAPLAVDRALVVSSLTGSEGVALGDPLAQSRGRVAVVDYDEGTVRWQRTGGFGSRTGASLDLLPRPSDSSHDAGLLVGAPGDGVASVLSVLDGTELLHVRSGEGGHFGHAVQSTGDIDGDAVTDFVVCAPRARGSVGAVYLYSGADGVLLDKCQGPFEQMLFGWSVVCVSSPEGPFVVVGAPWDISRGAHNGSVHAFTIKEGKFLKAWEVPGRKDYEMFGYSLSWIARFGESVDPLVVVGTQPQDSQAPSVRLISLTNGQVTHEFRGEVGTSLGFSMSRCLDLDDDGVEDVMMGAPSLVQAPSDPDRKGGLRFLTSGGRVSGRVVFEGRRHCGVSVGAVHLADREHFLVACQGQSLPGGLQGTLVKFKLD